MLEEFHRVFNAGINLEFTEELINLRESLISEECNEVMREFYPFDVIPTDRGNLEIELNPDKKKLTKELADLMYVTIGTAVTFGLPLKEVFEEVHKSNMSKVNPDGTINRRPDGKILKPDTYKAPNLDRFFND